MNREIPPAEELTEINRTLEEEVDFRTLADTIDHKTTERHAKLEESEAEKTREKYIRDLVRGAAENLMVENDELEGQKNEAEKMATKDPLTGINNRRGLEEELRKMASRISPQEYTHRRKSELGSMTVMFADIDHFKRINDTYGHDVGDEVLKTVARKFKDLMRTEDLVARYGGEEFVLVFENADQLEVLKKLGSRLPTVEITLPNGELIMVTFSAGIAEYHPNADIKTAIDDVVKRADAAMYQAKHGGRDQIVSFASPDETDRSQ